MDIKKFIAALLISFTIIFAAQSLTPITAKTYASKDACSETGLNDPLICSTKGGNEEKLQRRIRNTLNQVYLWVGIISVIVIVISGIKYMTSAGNPEKAKGAKNALLYSIIGLVITLAAFAITKFVIDAMNGKVSG